MVSYQVAMMHIFHVLSFTVVHSLHTRASHNAPEAFSPFWMPPEYGNIAGGVPPELRKPGGVGFLDVVQFLDSKMKQIGQNMGLDPSEFDDNITSWIGDGSMHSTKSAIIKRFKRHKEAHRVSNVIDYLVGQIGQPHEIEKMSSVRAYSMLAEQLGTKAFARRLAPLIAADSPPHPAAMFNLIGSQMALHDMPQPAVDLVHKLGEMYGPESSPDKDELMWLVNETNVALRNRTLGDPSARIPILPKDASHYKKTSNYGMVYFKLPCSLGAKVCFTLQMEVYTTKDGPGIFKGKKGVGPRGSLDTAFGVSILTKYARIEVPFYISSSPSVGVETEFDMLKDEGGFEVLPNRKTQIMVSIKLRETVLALCQATGDGSVASPNRHACPLLFLQVAGSPNSYHLGIMGQAGSNTLSDHFQAWFDLLRFSGEMEKGGGMNLNILPQNAYTGYYRNIGWNPALIAPSSSH